MDATYGQDLLSVDMDDLGVRPIDDWIDMNQTFDQSIEELFGKEKPTDFMIYAAGFGHKITAKDDDIVMSGDDDDDETENEYDIDPETGK